MCCMLTLTVSPSGAGSDSVAGPFAGLSAGTWIAATDTAAVHREGEWRQAAFRYASHEHLFTHEEGAALEMEVSGTGLILRLGAHPVPSYGGPHLGDLHVAIDGEPTAVLHPLQEPREVCIARGLGPGSHRVRISHRPGTAGTGCRVEGLCALDEPFGGLRFQVLGEASAHLVDLRARLTHNGAVVRETLVRNWMNGECSLEGIPPGTGYTLQLEALGWASHSVDGIEVAPDDQTRLEPVYLRRAESEPGWMVRFPRLGHPIIRQPGDRFRARLIVYQDQVQEVRLVRRVGPATISRALDIEEDTTAAFYYDREFIADIPADIPPGLYDLVAVITMGGADAGDSWTLRSPASVCVRASHPPDPLFMTFGHLDTWGQYQAEYLRQLADMANLFAPDMVLVSNEVNAAYTYGALAQLDMPHLVTFGNHQVSGHESWYGQPVDIVDFGDALAVLNFGLYWHDDLSLADALLAARANTRLKVINAVEHNAPVATFLDRHRVNLIHDGHGPGAKVMPLGTTPTLRVGKVNSESFRLVRFRDGGVVSATYQGAETDPIPFERGAPAPVRVAYSPANDGQSDNVTATVTNELTEAYSDCRLTFAMPRGDYAVSGGRLEDAVASDDGAYTVVRVRFDLPAQDHAEVSLTRDR